MRVACVSGNLNSITLPRRKRPANRWRTLLRSSTGILEILSPHTEETCTTLLHSAQWYAAESMLICSRTRHSTTQEHSHSSLYIYIYILVWSYHHKPFSRFKLSPRRACEFPPILKSPGTALVQ